LIPDKDLKLTIVLIKKYIYWQLFKVTTFNMNCSIIKLTRMISKEPYGLKFKATFLDGGFFTYKKEGCQLAAL